MSHDAILIPLPILLPQQPQTNPGAPSAGQSGGAPEGSAGTQQPAPAGGGPGQPSSPLDACGTQPMLVMLVMLGVVWFAMIGPERKRRKETQQMLQALKQGDRVVTLGGMHGVVATIAEKTVTLRCDQQRIVFDRSAITRIERDEPPAQEPKKG
jgi:preprotein translocase subunit YajC